MSRLQRVLEAVATDMEAPWALVGGLAVATRAEPRLTRDVDVAVAVDDDAMAEAVVFELQQKGYTVQSTVEHVPTGRLGTARLFPPATVADGVYVDLLFASCGIEREVVEAAEPRDVFAGITVPVARTGHLVAMKLLAFDARARPQDYDDVVGLLAKARPDDVAEARASVALICRRGFNRGRDLVSALADALVASNRA